MTFVKILQLDSDYGFIGLMEVVEVNTIFYVALYDLRMSYLIERLFRTRRYVYLQSDFDIRFLKISLIYSRYILIPDKFFPADIAAMAAI